MSIASLSSAATRGRARLARAVRGRSRLAPLDRGGIVAGCLARTGAFGTDRRGVAAVEFALVVPIMIALYFSTAELCNAIENHRKVVLFARVVADLSGRTSTGTTGSMTPIFNAASNVLAPFDATTVQIRVSAIGVEKKGSKFVGTVCSSAASANTTARAVKQTAGSNGIPDVPNAFQYDDAHYILAEVTMPYKPLVGSAIAKQLFGENGLTFKKQLPWADRTDTEVVLPGGSKCS